MIFLKITSFEENLPISVKFLAFSTMRWHCEGKAYTITGPEALTMYQAVDRISQLRGKPLQYVAVSAEEFKQGLLQSGQPEWLADILSELLTSLADGKQSTTTAIADLTKKQPISFQQFTQDYASIFQDQFFSTGQNLESGVRKEFHKHA